MARDRHSDVDYAGPVRRIVFGILVILLTALFLLWRIDSPRVERFRAALIDRFVPGFEWALVPVARIAGMIDNFQSYTSLYSQNQELRRELQQMKAWKEAAVQLEQQNAKLLAQNQVRLDPKLTSVSGVVMADSGSPFRQSVILNVGARDGIVDGWATMDGLGLVGRISGVGQLTSRVLLLTDASSRIPVTIQPSGQRAMLVGDNSSVPPLEFIEDPKLVRPGDRVVSSGDGGVFPAGLLVGQVAMDKESRLRVLLSADYERLDFLRVLRSHPAEQITEPGKLVPPPDPRRACPCNSAAPEPTARHRHHPTRRTPSPPARPTPANPPPRAMRPAPRPRLLRGPAPMVDPIRAAQLGHRLLFLGLVGFLLFIRILPLSAVPPEIPGPDLDSGADAGLGAAAAGLCAGLDDRGRFPAGRPAADAASGPVDDDRASGHGIPAPPRSDNS